jgi:hypothetical protein
VVRDTGRFIYSSRAAAATIATAATLTADAEPHCALTCWNPAIIWERESSSPKQTWMASLLRIVLTCAWHSDEHFFSSSQSASTPARTSEKAVASHVASSGVDPDPDDESPDDESPDDESPDDESPDDESPEEDPSLMMTMGGGLLPHEVTTNSNCSTIWVPVSFMAVKHSMIAGESSMALMAARHSTGQPVLPAQLLCTSFVPWIMASLSHSASCARAAATIIITSVRVTRRAMVLERAREDSYAAAVQTAARRTCIQ